MDDIRILQGCFDDTEELGQLYDDLNDYLESHTNYPGWKKGVYPTIADAQTAAKENTLYIAKSGDTLLGSIILNHKSEKSSTYFKWGIDAGDEEALYVHTFVVSPKYQGLGVGKRLLEFADILAGKKGLYAIRLDVYEKNYPAIGLYEKYGYKYIAKVDLGLGEYGLDWFSLYEKKTGNA